MRGIISKKLVDFIEQVNLAAVQATKDSVQLTPALVRANLDKLSAFIGEGPGLAYVSDKKFVTEQYLTLNHSISARIYSPAPKESLPVLLHFHGGGHMCGSIELYDAISRKIAKAGHCIVIAVEYRLAPEYPYPAGIDDCQFALENYQQVLNDINYRQEVIIAGDSAGGAICTTLSSKNLTNDTVNITKQILIYPSVDYSMSFSSFAENGTGFLLEREKVIWYFNQYFQGKYLDEQARKQVSPLYMAMNKSMPKTLVFTAGCDPLRDEGLAYIKALQELSINVEHHHFEGLIHAYMLLDSLVVSECEQTYKAIGEFVKS